ncbi:MAG TPA: hypothetical protein VFI73_11180 [Candidatus Nitrosopolaris sp.]|nr:hypothetical protein [Candidatus Nitrosopolaris sp.]
MSFGKQQMTATTNTTTQFFTKRNDRAIKKVSEFEFIEKDQAIGMRIPLRIYAHENLISNMAADCTIDPLLYQESKNM